MAATSSDNPYTEPSHNDPYEIGQTGVPWPPPEPPYGVVGTGTGAAVSPADAPLADLSVTQTACPNPVWTGQHMHYVLTVQNLGPSAAENTVLTDAVPGVLRCACYSLDGSNQCGRWIGTLPLGTLLPGEVHNILLIGTLMGCPTDSVTNTATVSSSTPDPDPSNNTAAITTRVIPPCGPPTTVVPDAYSQRFRRHITGTPGKKSGRGC